MTACKQKTVKKVKKAHNFKIRAEYTNMLLKSCALSQIKTAIPHFFAIFVREIK